MGKSIFICIFLATTLSLNGRAQTIDDIGKIIIGVKIDSGSSRETLDNSSLLQNKLKRIATNSGYSSYGMNMFFLSPDIVVSTIDVAEGGMKSITIVNADLYLSVQDSEGTVYSSLSLPFRGSGLSKEAAIKNGLHKVDYLRVQPLFDEAKAKILEFYRRKKNEIFAKAEAYAFSHDYDAAITCLMSIPEELFDVYEEAVAKAIDILNTKNRYYHSLDSLALVKSNNEILITANNHLAAHNASLALEALMDYTISGSNQDSEYSQLVARAETLISQEEKNRLEVLREARREAKEREQREWALHVEKERNNMQLQNRATDLEAARIRNRKEEIQNERKTLDNQAEYISAVKTVALKYIESQTN